MLIKFPLLPVGRMVLNKNPINYFAEVEQVAFGTGPIVSQKISRTNDYKQAGELYRSFEKWQRDDLILNLVTELKKCNPDIQARMVENFTKSDPEYGRRVQEGLRQ